MVRLLALVAVCAVGAAAPATAQLPEPERGRIQVGPLLSMTPSIVAVGGYDTNVIRTDTGKADGEYWFSPQVQGWLGRGRTRVNFVGALESQYPGRASATWNNFVRAEVQSGNPRLQATLMASRRDHYAPPTDFVGFEIGIRSRRVERATTATVGTGLGRIRLSGNGSFSQLRYDADQQFQGSSLRQNLNRNTLQVGGGIDAALSPLTSISASIEFFDDKFIYAPERDGSGYRALSGFTMGSAALISGYVRAGLLHYKSKMSPTSFTGPTYTTGLIFSRRSLLVDLRGTRDVGYSFDPSRGYYLTTGVDTYILYNAARSWEFFVRGSLRGVTPKGLAAELEPFRGIRLFKTGLARRFGLWTRLGAEVERYEYGGIGGFQGTRVISFLMYGGGRTQRLDRPLPGDF